MSATLLKKRHWHRCFLVNSAKFLRTPFLQDTSGHHLTKFECLCRAENSKLELFLCNATGRSQYGNTHIGEVRPVGLV